MATEDLETLGTLNYYLLEGYYRHVQVTVLEATRKYGSDPVLSLYKGLSLLHEGQIQECIREMQLIKDKSTVDLASHALLAHAHKRCRNVDKETVAALDARMKELRKRASEQQIYFLIIVFWHIKNIKSARDFADRLVKQNENFKQAIILKSWIELTSGRDMTAKKAGRLFDQGLADNKDPFGYIGRARCLIKTKKYSHAMESVNQVIVGFPNFVPAQAERMRIYLALMNWDQMVESAQKLLNMKSQYPEALILLTLNTITQNGRFSEAVNQLSELIQAIDRFEPQNPLLYFRCGRLFATVAGRNIQILNQTMTLVERAISLDDNNVEFAIEMAKQLFLMGKFKESNAQYKKCMQLDESSVHALLGSLTCQLVAMDNSIPLQQERNELQDIQDQLEFLTEIKDSTNIDAELFHLKAIHGRLNGRPSEELTEILEAARQTHFKNLGNTPLGADYFMQLNTDFLMMLVSELFNLIPSQPLNSGHASTPALKCVDMVLTTLNQVAPGMHEALFSRSKTLFIAGDMDGAMAMLEKCLENDVTFSPAHLLRAEIHEQHGNYAAVGKYLDTALSYNFEIREHPKYHLLKAKTQKHANDLDEAIKTLKIAMSLPGVKKPLSSFQTKVASSRKSTIPLDNGDRLSIFLELVEAHTSKNETHEAAKVMQDAINAFRGTPEEVRVKIANADLSLKRGDVEQALTMLRAIQPSQPYYIQAKQKMANIYLNHRKDRKLYTSCYRDLYETMPSNHTSLLLGDAYMKVQQPDNAVKIYEAALRKNPRDGALASKVGQALTTTHDFKKAITYYETAMKNGQKWLRFELALLLIKLKNFNKAERVLQAEPDGGEAGESGLEKAMSESKRLTLLANLYRETKRPDDEMATLNKARDVQAKVLKRVQIEQPDQIQEEKLKASNICCQLANYSRTVENNLQNAVKYLKEALIYCENDVKVMLELAKIEMQLGNDEGCQQYCQQVLRITHDNNDQASMMMADVMFNKKQYQDAIYHYEKLLDGRPDHYEALARLIGLLRRGGRLKDVDHFLSAAEKKSGRGKCEMDAGFQFCKGIYQWYCGRAADALSLLNRSRCDSEWNEKALEMMIRICLNPDQQTLGGEVFDSLSVGNDRSSAPSSNNNALSTAERLVKEFPSNDDPYKGQVLESLVLVASKSKPNAERALTIFVDICQKKREYVPALLGMAIAYQILKQTPRARNQLKRISKMQWTHEDAEDLESGWLLLADLYITAGKYDMASDLLKKCLEHNKSCCKAYEYLGFIYEKEQSYKDAASHYDTAWQYSNQNNPVIGYKLAFNYLKAKKHVEAINVSHKVLQIHPEYPRMKKEILDKARLALRV